MARSAVFDLLAATGAGGNDERFGSRFTYGGQQAALRIG